MEDGASGSVGGWLMIPDFLLGFGMGLGTFFVGLLPVVPLSLSALDAVGNGVGLVFGLVDMAAVRLVAVMMIGTEVSLWGVGVLLKVWQQIKW